jgi:DNA-binding transcriptional ArsR family regulator
VDAERLSRLSDQLAQLHLSDHLRPVGQLRLLALVRLEDQLHLYRLSVRHRLEDLAGLSHQLRLHCPQDQLRREGPQDLVRQ